MADNTTLNPGVGGDTYASDDIGGVKHQRVKAQFGADGSATDVADADGSRLPVKTAKANTGTRTQVTNNASSVIVLSANANRKQAVIANDSAATLYLGLGASAVSTTDYTTKLEQDQTYDVPESYTGEIRGIWASAPGGGARVTELT